MECELPIGRSARLGRIKNSEGGSLIREMNWLWSLIPFAVGLVLLSLSWLRPQNARGKRLREWGLPITGLLGWLIVLAVVMNLCAMGLSVILPSVLPNASGEAYRVVGTIGALAGGYACAIGLQVLGNIMRRARGLPPLKLHWIRIREK